MKRRLGKTSLTLILSLTLTHLVLVGCGRLAKNGAGGFSALSEAELDELEQGMREVPEFAGQLDDLAAKYLNDTSVRGVGPLLRYRRHKDAVLRSAAVQAQKAIAAGNTTAPIVTVSTNMTNTYCSGVGAYRNPRLCYVWRNFQT